MLEPVCCHISTTGVLVFFSQLLSIRIVDLQLQGQDRELQRRRIFRLMTFYGLQDDEEISDLSQIVFA